MTQAEATTCGCATAVVGTSGSTTAGACGCMGDTQKPSEQTIEELRALRDTIDRRLAALEG